MQGQTKTKMCQAKQPSEQETAYAEGWVGGQKQVAPQQVPCCSKSPRVTSHHYPPQGHPLQKNKAIHAFTNLCFGTTSCTMITNLLSPVCNGCMQHSQPTEPRRVQTCRCRHCNGASYPMQTKAPVQWAATTHCRPE